MSNETQITKDARLHTAKLGWRLWRNNKGAGKLENGSFLRWGLCNDNASIGSTFRSADLIGIRLVTITPEMVGKQIGQFVSVELKRPGWKPTNDEHYKGQLNWKKLVELYGGAAWITSNVEDLK